MFEVEWTGSYPNLCNGMWIIRKNGLDVSNVIPEDLRHNEMGTYSTYSRWNFDNDYNEEWEYYNDGMSEIEWIAKNKWIDAICDTEEEKLDLFHLISSCDWRHGSCGGCI